MWIGTWNGLNRFDRHTGTCTRYMRQKHTGGSVSDNAVRSLYGARTGVLWIGTWEEAWTGEIPVQDRFEHFRRLATPAGERRNTTG